MAVAAALVPVASPAAALDTSGAVITDPSCVANTLPANDDGSSTQVDLPFSVNFYGTTYSTMWVNNNGNVTFNGPLSTFTPFGLLATRTPIIAPFFADVDTRAAGSSPVQYGYGTTVFQGHAAVCVNWVNVGYFNVHADKLNSFQMLLVSRPDKGTGAFDIVFNYDQIQWETGDSSGGSNGYGGTPARVGFSSGAGVAGTATELPGSGVSRSFLDQTITTDGSPSGLKWSHLNSDVLGRYVFSVRGDGVVGDTYVAMGDSFQSGEGAFTYLDGTDTDTDKCHRAPTAYPELLVNRGVVRLNLDFVACSGAVMVDLLSDHPVDGHSVPYDEGAQIDHLGDDTRLVTIGIVGNDLKFSSTVQECIEHSLSSWVINPFIFDTSCAGNMDNEVNGRLNDLKSGSTGDYLLSIYRLVRLYAPYARVVVVSYPRFFPVDGADPTCATIRASDQRWMNSKIATADQYIGQIAREAGFEYVNMADVLNGHEQCTAQPGMNGILLQASTQIAKSESFHPNVLGHSMMADLLAQKLNSSVVPSFTIHMGETVSRAVTVSGQHLAVNVAWPGSDVVTTLTSPSGVVYTRQAPRDADHGNGPTFEYFGIDNPEHGTWSVSMYGANVDPAGEAVTFDAYDVPVPNQAPLGQFTVTGSGQTFHFDAGASSDPDGSIASYRWDFGDGTTGTGQVVDHTYAYAGSFAPVLEVVDNDGESGFHQAATNVTVSTHHTTVYSGASLQLTNTVTTTGPGDDVVVNGDVECNSTAAVGGDLIATGNVHLTNQCHIGGDVHAGGTVVVDSTPTVTGSITAVGDVSIQSTAHVGGNLTTGGHLTYIDARATTATGAPVIAGTITQGAQVSPPTVTAPAPPVTPTGSTTTSWASWLNATASANSAPSWSPGLTANPGCTLAPWGASVNGPTAALTSTTVIDARVSTTGCATITIQDMTLQLGGDVTILADAFASPGHLTVTSTDGTPHTLHLVVPGQITGCSSAGAIRFSGPTTTTNGARLDASTPGTLTVNGTSSIDGALHAGCVKASGGVTLTTSS